MYCIYIKIIIVSCDILIYLFVYLQLTWVEHFLGLGMTCTEGAVELEVVGIVQERPSKTEEHPLWTESRAVASEMHIKLT